MASREMNHGDKRPSLACLIGRSAELKHALVGFALSPRFERHLEQFTREGAGCDEALIGGEAIDAINRFALQHRLPDGETVLAQFLVSCVTESPGITSVRPSRHHRDRHPPQRADRPVNP